jgi:Uncharacterized protein conserved in bacteria
VNAVTEDDIAAYLLNTPDFFVRNADLLASIQLTSPHGQRAVSLQERQMELLREKIKGLELRIVGMLRAGGENDLIHQRLLEWTLLLLQERDAQNIPGRIVEGLASFFNVPQVALRLWGLDDAYAAMSYAQPVSNNVRSFVNSMNGEPYCGRNPDLEVVQLLDSATEVRSVALLPLCVGGAAQAMGMIVLGSQDVGRFTPDMGIDILKSIATIATNALVRCTKEREAQGTKPLGC